MVGIGNQASRVAEMRLVVLWERRMKPWKTKTRKTILEQRPWLVVENHTVELPDGRLIPD